MANTSAGILLYRRKPSLQVLLAHPGGPYWQNKDDEAWTIPKGEIEEGEEPKRAAKREFAEELGFLPDGELLDLGKIKQKGGKEVWAWAVEHDIPEDFIFRSNTFEMEWPPDSGNKETFFEIDRIEYFGPFEARTKINPAQIPFISRLIKRL